MSTAVTCVHLFLIETGSFFLCSFFFNNMRAMNHDYLGSLSVCFSVYLSLSNTKICLYKREIYCFFFLQCMIMLVVNVVCDRSGTYFYFHIHIAHNVQNRNLKVCKFQLCPFIVKLNPTKYTQQIISYIWKKCWIH